MSKRFAKVVSYLLVIALVMQDGLPAAAANNLTGRAERMTVLENDSGGVSDKEEVDDKASNNQEVLEENADKETPSEEQSEDKKTQEEKQDDKASDNEEQSEDKTSEDEQSENKTSEEESAAENESNDDKQTTTEESSETETETDIKITETETESETKTTETAEDETETAVEEKTVKAEEDISTYVEEFDKNKYEKYEGDEASVSDDNMFKSDLFTIEGEGLKYWSDSWGPTKWEKNGENSITIKLEAESGTAPWGYGLLLKDGVIELKQGSTYEISYKIKSTKARDVVIDFQQTPDNDRKKLALKEDTETTVCYYITPTTNLRELAFYLGEYSCGSNDVTISDLSIKEVTVKLADGDTVDEKSDNLLKNGTFKEGNIDGWTTGNEVGQSWLNNATVKTAKYKVAFDINEKQEDYQAWLRQNDITFTSGSRYKITFDATSTVNRFIGASVGGTWLQHKELKANEKTTVEYKVTGINDSYFVIALGSNLRASSGYKDWDGNDISISEAKNQNLDPHRVTISNVCITEELPELEDDENVGDEIEGNLLKNGKFKESNTDSWTVNTNEGSTTIVKKGKIAFNIASGTSEDSDISLKQDNIKLEKDKKYTITFKADSTIKRDILLGCEDTAWIPVELDPSKKEYTYEVSGIEGNNFIIALGSNLRANTAYNKFDGDNKEEVPAGTGTNNQELKKHRVILSDICIVEGLSEFTDGDPVEETEGNLLKNGTFKDIIEEEKRPDSWNINDTVTAKRRVAPYKVAFDINGSQSDWTVWLKQDNISFDKDTKYTITFKAESTVERDILIGNDNTWLKPCHLEANKEATVSYQVLGMSGDWFAIALGTDLRDSSSYQEWDGEDIKDVDSVPAKKQSLPLHRVTISNVCITRVIPELKDDSDEKIGNELASNLLENGKFKDGKTTDPWKINTKEGEATTVVKKGKIAFEITGKNATKDSEISLEQNVTLKKDKKYRITFKAQSTINRSIMVNCGDTWLQPKELKIDEDTDVLYEVTGVEANNFMIALGSDLRANTAYTEYIDGERKEIAAGEENKQESKKHRVVLSNICIIEVPDTPNDTLSAKMTNLTGYDGWTPSQLAPLKDGKFARSVKITMGDKISVNSPENAVWSLWHEEWMTAEGVKCTPEKDGMKFLVGNTGGGDGNKPWDIQLSQPISLRAGKQYVLSFKVYSDQERSINVHIPHIDGGKDWVKPIAIEKGETREVILKLPILAENADNKTFTIQMGHLEGMPLVKDGTLTFTDMKLEIYGYSELAERISDGYFSEKEQGSFTVTDNGKANVSFEDKYIHVVMPSDCQESDVVVSSGKFDMLGNQNQSKCSYEVSFVAGSKENRQIKAALVDGSGKTLKEVPFDLTIEAKKYTFTYSSDTNQKDATLKLMFGGGQGTVCVDTIRCDLQGYPEAVGLDTEEHDISILKPASVPVISEMPADQAVAGNDIVISFDKAGNEDYKNGINQILIDGVEIAADKYTIGERAGANGRNDEYIITLDESLFDVKEERQTYTIEVRAAFYHSNKLHQTVYAKGVWRNTWLEEFDGDKLDMNKWSYQIGRGDNNDGWGNREQQYYTDDPKNIAVENGELVITARKDRTEEGANYSSARIWTMNDDGKTAKFSQKYGRMEAKMRVDASENGLQGIWPAFWMLPVDLQYGTWPLSGEIDILEARGREPHLADGTVHFGKPYPNNESSGGVFNFKTSKYNQDSDINDYHIYAVEWEPGEIRWYVDDELYFKESNWYCQSFNNPERFRYPAPFDQEFYIILNLAIGGMFDNDLKPTDDKMPAKMEVDYVRVYESTNGYNENIEAPLVTEDEEVTPYDEDVKSELLDTDFTGINRVRTDNDTQKRNVWNLVTLSQFHGDANFATITKDGTTYAKITPTQLGDAAYAIQLIQAVDLVKGYYYRISFDAWTEGNRSLNMKIGQDGTEGWNVYQTFETALTESPKRYQCEFQAKKTDRHSRVEFNLATSNCPVYIGNIQYEVIKEIILDPDAEKAPSEDGNCVYNGSFDVGSISGLDYWHLEDCDGKTERDADKKGYHFTATKGKLYQNGLELLKNDSYKLTFLANAASERQIEVILSNKEGNVEYLKEKVTLTPDKKVHEFTFDMTKDTDTNAKLCFVFGDGSSKIDLTGIWLVRTTYNNVNWEELNTHPLLNGDFELGDKYWGCYKTTFSIKSDEKNNHYAEVQAIKSKDKWDATFGNNGIGFTANTEYEFSFRAKASKAGESVRVTMQEGAPSYYSHYTLNEVNLNTEWTTYKYDIKFRESHDNLSLTFSVGGASEDYQFCIDDVVLQAKGSPKAAGIIETEKYNRQGTDIILSYYGEEEWAKNAVVYIDNKSIDKDKTKFENKKLTLDKSLFPEAKKYTIVVRSEGYTASRSIEIRIYPANGNLILNGDFALGKEFWGEYIREQADYIAPTEDGAIKVHYNGPGDPASWAIQLIQDGIPVKKNQKYQLSFYIRTTKPRWIDIIRNQTTDNQKERHQYEEIKEVTDERVLHKVEFTTTDESDTLKLQFALSTVGANGAPVTDLSDWTEHDIYLDDICLLEVPEDGKIVADKSTLQKLVDEYAALKADKDKYIQKTYEAFETAYSKAEETLKAENPDQCEIIKAEDDLRSARDGLQMPGDKSVLNDSIEQANAYKQEDYTEKSWKTFTDALSEAKKVADNPEALQKEVDEACDALTRAGNGLVPNEMINDLNKLIEECKTYSETDHSAKSWKRFQSALKKAEDAVGNPDVTKSEITSAKRNLEDAKANLEWTDPRKAELGTLVGQCSVLKKEDYTEDSWIPFDEALTTARNVLASKDATDEAIQNAVNELTAARDGLKEVGKPNPVNKDNLRDIIDKCEALNQNDYLPEKWNAFTEALDNARAVAENENATQEEIDSAVETLNNALVDLKPREGAGLWAFDIADVIYTGKAIKPAVTVYNGKTLLVEKKDYTVTYKNNTKATTETTPENKKPCIVIKGKGNYNGSITKVFNIIPKDLNAADIMIQDLYVKEPKPGKKIIPAPVVTRNGKKLSKKEYEIGAINMIVDGKESPVEEVTTAGTYSVEVKGVPEKGYGGTRSIRMVVINSNQKLMSAVKVTKIKNIPYNEGKSVTPEFTVKDGSIELVKDVNYEVICNSWEVGTATATIKGIDGTYIGEKTVTFKITGTALKAKDVTVTASNKVYTGSAITADEVKVTVASQPLVLNSDYIVSYDKHVKAGNAVVTVTGIGQYTGTVKKTFKIASFDLNSSNDNEHKLELNYNKTEGIKIPYAKGGSKLDANNLEIIFNTIKLTEGVDYTLVYKKNTKVGDASVQIKGKGNFKGTTVEIPFTITSQSLENLRSNITVMDVLEKKAKNYKKVTTIIKDLDGKALKKGTDFEIIGFYPTEESKEELTEVPKVDNKVYVAIKGKGNYEGEVREAFRIIGNDKDISKAKVTVDPQIYTGNEIKLKDPLEDGDEDPIQVTMKGVSGNLKRGTDYKIVGYSNNINKGSGKITIQGIGSYGGIKTATFKINAHDFNDKMPWYENYYSRIMSWFNESFSQ